MVAGRVDALATLIFKLSPSKSPLYQNTSKGSYRSWKKIVKVWMLMMMKEGIFAGHPSLVHHHLDLALLALGSHALAPLALTLAFALLHSPLPPLPFPCSPL